MRGADKEDRRMHPEKSKGQTLVSVEEGPPRQIHREIRDNQRS